MKLRITSPELGKVDADGKMGRLKVSGDYVVATVAVETKTNFDLDTKLALDHRDLIRLMGLFIKGNMALFLVKGLKNRSRPRPLPKKW
ncbi:MAG: hypothetical protein QUS33_01620 [Dehalococcoidia bacterium]|nr:hypothetical protein [Dehalococcoidia bacterium]